MVFRRWPNRLFFLPSSKLDWSKVGDGTGSSTVMAPLLWIVNTFPEAPPALYQQLDNGQEKQVFRHPLLRLLDEPNPFYAGTMLWMATLIDWNVDGNAYWIKLRDGTGAVKQLWWAPHWTIAPRGDENNYITHYVYAPNGVPGQLSSAYGQSFDPPDSTRLDVEDVIHFRFGLDANDSRLGYSPLKSVLREVYTDDEAANMTASLLRNMGVPGLVVSPKSGSITPEQAQTAKDALIDMFTGDRRGEPWVNIGPTDVQQFGFSPQDLTLRDLRRVPEERVSAVLRVPAIVAGLGAGLDRSTFTNYSEAREAAYEQNIIPSQRTLGEAVRFQLLRDFEPDPHEWRFGFDLKKVRVLLPAEDQRRRSFIAEFNGGVATRATTMRNLGYEPDPDGADDVFLQPLHSVLVPAGEVFVNPAEASSRAPASDSTPPDSAAANGNGTNGLDAHQSAAVAAEVARQLQTQGSSR